MSSLLTPWRQKQAAMLEYYSSLGYLAELHRLVTHLIAGEIEPVLDLAKSQGRDKLLADQKWGVRDTSQNWSDHAWGYLKDFQASLAGAVAQRQSGIYKSTAVHQYLRGVEQFSTNWMTPDEEKRLAQRLDEICEWAAPLDLTVAEERVNGWNDFRCASYYLSFRNKFRRIPRYRIRTDVVRTSGEIPEYTGIYVPKDDPHASLQFAWSGAEPGPLRSACTFNDLGLAALAAVGRNDLWFNDQKMFEFAITSSFAPILHDDVIWRDGPHPQLAASAVGRRAFTKRKSDWYLVERVDGVFDDLDSLGSDAADGAAITSPRLMSGEKCNEPGYYISPSHPDSRRYISRGELAPDLKTGYGATIWQWDANQT